MTPDERAKKIAEVDNVAVAAINALDDARKATQQTIDDLVPREDQMETLGVVADLLRASNRLEAWLIHMREVWSA